MRKQTVRFLALVNLVWMLGGCAFWHQPSYRNIPAEGSLTPGEEITVGAGQNVYSVAQKYNVSMRDIISLNNLKTPFVLKEGQTLVLPTRPWQSPRTPQAAPSGAIEAVPLEPVSGVSSSQLQGALDSSSKNGIGTSPLDIADPAAQMPLTTTVANADQARGTTDMYDEDFVAQAPLQGPVLAGFGPKSDGASNDGMNIGAPKGSPVVAAAGGIVVYSGNEMKGFGNLILIRHENGWVTAYAHLERMLVTRDAIVAAGDQIGTVGTTGGVSTPQLHFETRHNGTPVDPKTVLNKKG